MSYWTPMELALLEENQDKINALDKDNPEEVVAFVENLIRENIHGLNQEDIYKWRFGFYERFIPQSLKVVIGPAANHQGNKIDIYFKIKLSFNFKGASIIVFNSSDVFLVMGGSDYKNWQKDPIKFKDFIILALPEIFDLFSFKRVNVGGCFEREMKRFLTENDKFEMGY